MIKPLKRLQNKGLLLTDTADRKGKERQGIPHKIREPKRRRVATDCNGSYREGNLRATGKGAG